MIFSIKEIKNSLKEKLPNLSLKDIDAFLGITTYHNLNNEIVLDIDDYTNHF